MEVTESRVDQFHSYCKEMVSIPLLLRMRMYSPTIVAHRECVRDNGKGLVLTDVGLKEVNNYFILRSNPYADISVNAYSIIYSTLRYEEEKKLEVVSSGERAKEIGRLGTYYKSVDFLEIMKDEDEVGEYVYATATDYYDYVRKTYDKKFIAMRYMDVMKKKAFVATDIDYTTFNYSGVMRALSQMEEYHVILDGQKKVVLSSDGYGFCSCYCILNGIEYFSSEPNGVGEVARQLGIIHSKTPIYTTLDIASITGVGEEVEERFLEEYLYVYFYCVQYYNLPEFPYQRYVILDVPHIHHVGRYVINEFCSSNDKELLARSKQIVEVHKRKRRLLMDDIHPLDELVAEWCKQLNKRIKSKQKSTVIIGMTRDIILKFASDESNKKYLSKVLHLPSWSYPFRNSEEIMGKLSGDKLLRHVGVGEYYYERGFLMKRDEETVTVNDYILKQDLFIVPGSRTTPIRYIQLRTEDKDKFHCNVVQVYLLSSMKVGSVIYGMYAENSNTRPQTII